MGYCATPAAGAARLEAKRKVGPGHLGACNPTGIVLSLWFAPRASQSGGRSWLGGKAYLILWAWVVGMVEKEVARLLSPAQL